MESYRITAELFYLPQEDQSTIVYAPLLGFVCHGNQGLIDLLSDVGKGRVDFSGPEQRIIDYFIAKKVINGSEKKLFDRQTDFTPSSLSLFPTNQCNMRCIYCYAMQDQKNAKIMPWHIAKNAVDFFVESLVKTDKKLFPLEFHGPGEPFIAWPLMKKITAYAAGRCQELGLELKITAGSNGALTLPQLKWSLQNFHSLIISFEGLEKVQNQQRPFCRGGPSFGRVDRALRFFDERHFPYAIRTTVSSANQPLLGETLEYIMAHYKCRTWIIEPMRRCSVMENLLIGYPDMELFATQLFELEERALRCGVRVIYSSVQLERRSSTFCHLGTDEIAVTPDGCLTNCWEVSSPDHPHADDFIFGRVPAAGKVEIDKTKWASFRNYRVENLARCHDCFAKYHCSGGCGLNRNDTKITDSFCTATRGMIRQRLIRLATTGAQ